MSKNAAEAVKDRDDNEESGESPLVDSSAEAVKTNRLSGLNIAEFTLPLCNNGIPCIAPVRVSQILALRSCPADTRYLPSLLKLQFQA